MQAQDARLDELSLSVRRQKHIGGAINQELQLHNELLGGLDAAVDNTKFKMKRADQKARKLNS